MESVGYVSEELRCAVNLKNENISKCEDLFRVELLLVDHLVYIYCKKEKKIKMLFAQQYISQSTIIAVCFSRLFHPKSKFQGKQIVII